jgi:hypothetical protein
MLKILKKMNKIFSSAVPEEAAFVILKHKKYCKNLNSMICWRGGCFLRIKTKTKKVYIPRGES